MEALRAEFKEKYPGDEIYSDEADEAWSKAYQEMRDSEENKAAMQRAEKIAKELEPFFLQPPREGTFDKASITRGYVRLYLRK
jgi:hypothetical protein